MPDGKRPDLLARLLGVLTFVGGLAIIAFVLKLGYGLYTDPTLGHGLKPAKPTDPVWTGIVGGFVSLVVRILLLFLGSVCGSLIANKGLRLYVGALTSVQSASRPTSE
ncbi:MAG: hypothetical protein FJX72_08430 [Armatimonadetes bacterium]|nr:hypothetical protein [Armatimonadota bacterium]